MRLRIIILALLYSCSSLFAQKQLAVGDVVPGIRFHQVVNHSSSSASLSDFKGKLVIIDFWATWCTACLHAFGKLDSLQASFGDQVKIILVNSRSTGDDLSKVQGFFRKWQTRRGKKLSLPSVVNDTIMEKLFPHTLIPHYVWIDKEGRLIAVSSSDAVTPANIQSALNGEQLSFTMKKDQDLGRPLFSAEALPAEKLLNYSLFLKGWFDGLPSGSQARQKGDVICGRAMTNTSLLDIYKTAATGIDPSITEKHILLNSEDSAALFPPLETKEREAWYKQHAYTIDLIVPVEEGGHLYYRMLDVLNLYSGYIGSFEKRKINCWILLKTGNSEVNKTKEVKTINHLWVKDGPYLKKGTTQMLVNRLNSLSIFKSPVVDETNCGENINMDFPGGFSSIESVQQQLSKYGFELRKAERVINVFVLQKKP